MTLLDIPSDPIYGQKYEIGTRSVLLTASGLSALTAEPARPWQLFYAFSFVVNPYTFFFPKQLINERGVLVEGLAVPERIAKVGQLYPRDEVSGYHADGKNAEYFVRDFELGLPMATFAIGGDDFPGQRIFGAFEVTPLKGDLAITPGGFWPNCLRLSVPTYQLDSRLPPDQLTEAMLAALERPPGSLSHTYTSLAAALTEQGVTDD